ncbi:MAG TPA: hypothetical protein VG388_03795 [Solirubrobacteraceae bacterium]|jgi:hypothetical protein|nr:hypothetical protein [Solirubrobacteraceae bacterium]
MPDPLQALLAAGAVPSTTLPPTSRYAQTPVQAWDPGAGRPAVPYLGRRFCPPSDTLALLYQARIAQGDRRDVLAWRHLGAAELWWQLADSGGAIDPRELTAMVGAVLRITLPPGVPGMGNG